MKKKLFISWTISLFLGCCAVPAWSQASTSSPINSQNQQSPYMEQRQYEGQEKNDDLHAANSQDTMGKAQDQPAQSDTNNYGMGLGAEEKKPLAKQINSDNGGGGSGAGGGAQWFVEQTAFQSYVGQNLVWKDFSTQNGASAGTYNSYLNDQLTVTPLKMGTCGDDSMSCGNNNYAFGGGGGGGGCGSGTGAAGNGTCTSGLKKTTLSSAASSMNAAAGASQKDGEPKAGAAQAQANQSGCQASSASCSGEDAMELMQNAFDGMTQYLVNVANENAGSPCSSDQLTKTYENAVWMVMQMYKACFLPMAILFLLPGAIITNTKTMVSFGILSNNNDDDAVNPFAGIIRSIIAIFLIPASQMIVSYMVDVGNSLQYSCQPYINVPLIMMWAEEQVQIFNSNQQGNPIKNMPNVPMAPWRGKAAGMPVAGAVMEQVSGLDAAIADLANECMHMLSEGLTICYAFQLVMLCYLFCLGPLAAAFFAWPSVGRDLFRKCFASWVDAVVVLCLWKFWWDVVLICMTVRLQSGGVNPFDPFEVYYLVAFLCILMFVPFSPFDFKPGTIVQNALDKANAVATSVASKGGQGAGGGGGGGQGGSSGGQSAMGGGRGH